MVCFGWRRRDLAVCSKHSVNYWVGMLQRGSCSWSWRHVVRRAGCQHGHAWQVSKILLLRGFHPAFANGSSGWLGPKASLALGRLASFMFLYLQGSHLAVFGHVRSLQAICRQHLGWWSRSSSRWTRFSAISRRYFHNFTHALQLGEAFIVSQVSPLLTCRLT